MKTKLFLGLMLAATVFSGSIFAAPKPKVSMERAQEIALRRVSGEVEKSDTITKHNKATYSFFIKKSNGVTTHVLVNEKGKIKRVSDEKPSKSKIK